MTKISPLLCFSLLVTRALINQPFLWESSAKPNLTGDQSSHTVYDHSHPRRTTQPDALFPYFNSHFPGRIESAGTRMSPFCILLQWLRWWWQLQLHAKLQSNHHHQQTNTRCTHTHRRRKLLGRAGRPLFGLRGPQLCLARPLLATWKHKNVA